MEGGGKENQPLMIQTVFVCFHRLSGPWECPSSNPDAFPASGKSLNLCALVSLSDREVNPDLAFVPMKGGTPDIWKANKHVLFVAGDARLGWIPAPSDFAHGHESVTQLGEATY